MQYKIMLTITDPVFLVILSLSLLKLQTKAVMDGTFTFAYTTNNIKNSLW